MRVELYGVARLRAGVEAVEVDGETLGDVLRALADRFPALDVTDQGWLISLDGERFIDDPDMPLPSDAKLLLLSAQAGG
ncbi:MAG: MoaD/ThiS family protein [Planctomycetota bacterium]